MNKNQEQEYYYRLVLVLVGTPGVGKTSLLTRITDDKFQSSNLASIDIDFRIKTTIIDGHVLKGQIWNTKLDQIVSSLYYRGASGIFLTFDTTSEESFQYVQKVMESIKGVVDDDLPKVLVGCKADLEEQRSIAFDQALALANDLGLFYIETSAKTGYNCSKVYDTLSKLAFSYAEKKGPKFYIVSGKKEQKVGKCW